MHDDDRRSALYRSLVHDAFGFIAAIGPDLRIELVGRSVTAHVGHQPDELEGTSVADFIHPEDLERALLLLGGWEQWGAPNGAASFRLRHADGSWPGFDVTASHVSDGHDDYLAVYCTPIDYQHATDEVLARLLRGADRGEALAPVVDVFSWRLNEAQVAIAWHEPGVGHRFVSTGIPAELAGARTEAGEAWVRARRELEPVLDLDQSTLTPELAALAAEHGRGGLWVVPVADPGSPIPALISVWARANGPRPDGHSYGMEIATTYVDLILRWSNQVALLHDAVRRDPLTGLGNRMALFELLDGEGEHGSVAGALLYCDLDRFKPVNDDHGHTVGDRVLREVAQRIASCAGPGDLVARAGGDEFVVIIRSTDTLEPAGGPTAERDLAARVRALADRIRHVVGQPLDIEQADGTPISIHVGVTIGASLSSDGLTEADLAAADRALLAAKADDRGTLRFAPPSSAPQ